MSAIDERKTTRVRADWEICRMNAELTEINNIISICDAMIADIQKTGILRTGDPNYEEYKSKIKDFFISKQLYKQDYGPYAALDALWFSKNGYTVNISEAETIRKIVIELKHKLFPTSFEKIFISHREKDKDSVGSFVELLYTIGIPRRTLYSKDSIIFCTSHPTTYIGNGKRNLDEIKHQFNSTEHVFFILWYSDAYFESQACLNEAGAIWAMNKRYQEILMPGFDSSKIGGLTDKQPVWFRANDKFRLNDFKKQLELMFSLDPLESNTWEIARDEFISKVSKIYS